MYRTTLGLLKLIVVPVIYLFAPVLMGTVVVAAALPRSVSTALVRGTIDSVSQSVEDGYPTETIDWILRKLAAALTDVENNPLPFVAAALTFVATVVYHKIKGRSLREAVQAAVTKIAVEVKETAEPHPLLERTRLKLIHNQLIYDQIAVENRVRALPDKVRAAEKDVCYTADDLDKARAVFDKKEVAHKIALERLDALRTELVEARATLAETTAQIVNLKPLI